MQRLLHALSDVVFPPICVHCDNLVEDHGESSGFRHVCTKCSARIEYTREPCCTTCGHPFYGELAGERICEHCQGLRPKFREGRTAVLFKGAARTLIHELKYHRTQYVLHDIATIIRHSPRVLELARGATLVPVPLHSRKERERGYNQGRLIAECIANEAGGGAKVEMLLKRIKDRPSQTTLDRASRRANMKNAFALVPGKDITAGHHYVIVDDVFTTGSTLNSCASVLRRAGCVNLDVLTFGHG